jgi:hypothetical protein
MSNFVNALDDSLRDGTATIGQQDNYAQAMRQYAAGSQRAEFFDALRKKYGPALISGALAGLGFKYGARHASSLLDLLTNK